MKQKKRRRSITDRRRSSATVLALAYSKFMPKARLELARPCEHCDLNTACIPFHHFGTNIPRGWAGMCFIVPRHFAVVKFAEQEIGGKMSNF